MTAEKGAALRRLWKEAFGDTDETLDAFFSLGFSPNRYACIWEKDVPVSTLYWFDCACEGQKFAYLYAVATLQSHRGRGFARRLLEDTHSLLRKQGYAGVILVPGSEELFHYYGNLGYRAATGVSEFSCHWGDVPVKLTEIDTARYAALRRTYLPHGGVVQEGKTLDFLSTYTRFYEGTDFLLCACEENGTLLARELLGNSQAAPGILRALNAPNGQFRTPGTGRDFAMFLPLREGCPTPAYFGLALD